MPRPPRARWRRRARSSSEGDLFGIYPEGTRSHDGRLYRGKTGVARLALETGVPVIPVAVLGTDVVAPPGKKFGTFTRPGVRFGKPLDFSRYEGMENDRYILRAITDEIMYEIMQLSGQEYVDLYATQGQGAVAEVGRRGQARRARGPRGAGRGRRAEAGILTPAAGLRFPVRPTEPAAIAVEDRMYRWLAVLRFVLVANAVGPQHLPRRLLPPGGRARCCWRHGGVDLRDQLGLPRLHPAYDGLGRRRPGGRPGRRSA